MLAALTALALANTTPAPIIIPEFCVGILYPICPNYPAPPPQPKGNPGKGPKK